MRSTARRTLTLCLTGGLLLQIGGCAAGLAPIGLSVIESILVREFFLRLVLP